MARPLRTIYWNANGLNNKTTLLRALLEEQDIDVALLCETHLCPTKRFHIAGYHTYRQDHPPADSGTSIRGLAVLVRRNIVHQVLPSHQLRSVQGLGIELLLTDRPHRLYSVYRPPRTKLDLADVDAMIDTQIPTALAGDWNAKSPAWNSSKTCSTGRRLLLYAEKKGYDICGPEAPTHYPFQDSFTPDVLDIVIASRLLHLPSLENLNEAMGSDHLPVLAIFKPDQNVPPPAPRRKINWEIFTELARKHAKSSNSHHAGRRTARWRANNRDRLSP